MLQHPYYETPRQRQTDRSRYIECRGGGNVRVIQVFETLLEDAKRNAASRFRWMFGTQPETVEAI